MNLSEHLDGLPDAPITRALRLCAMRFTSSGEISASMELDRFQQVAVKPRRVDNRMFARVPRIDVRRFAVCAGSVAGAVTLIASSALASPALLTVGHAYCYYFSSPGNYGGMHLVAASPTVIAAGPSNYVSGLRGTAQDTVFYIDCIPGAARVGGTVYIGMPRMAAHIVDGHYGFSDHFVVRGVRHLDVASRITTTATVTLTGAVSAGAIVGSLKVTVPGCLPRARTIVFTGR